jgi:acetamidase/formamidase
MGFDEDLDDAAKAALRDMIVLIRDHTGLSAQDATRSARLQLT